MRLSIRSILVVSVILVAACGGTKIEVTNGTGSDFMLLEVAINGAELGWSSVDIEQTVSGYLTIPETPIPPIAIISWDNGFGSFEEEICLVDSAAMADKIWIHLSWEVTMEGTLQTISLNYSF